MSNNHIHHAMLERLAPFIPLEKPHRVFAVVINLGGDLIEYNILAKSSIQAITMGIDLLMDEHEHPPADGLTITAKVQP